MTGPLRDVLARLAPGAVLALGLGLGLSLPVAAFAGDAPCRALTHESNDYVVCTADAGRDDIRLFLNGPDGALLGQFSRIDQQLAPQGLQLAFAMNAGMYHDDRRPVGLYVEDGVQAAPLVAGPGPGNFGMVPNGIFCVGEGRADVIETARFQRAAPECRHASQSGPMLVIDGALHPRFLVDSTSRFIRNGVGSSADGQEVHFVISSNPVTFHEFGRLFRDVLEVPNALYFDGNISRLHAPGMARSDLGFRLGPIVGVVIARP